MNPATMMAIASIVSGALSGASGIMGAKSNREAKEKELEEIRKKREMDFTSQGLDRDQMSGMDIRKGNRDIAQSRAQIMQGMAQNFNLGARHA